MEKIQDTLGSLSGHAIELLGELSVQINYEDMHKKFKLIFDSGQKNNPIGRDWIYELKFNSRSLEDLRIKPPILRLLLPNSASIDSHNWLVAVTSSNLQNILSRYENLFNDELGHCKKFKATLHLKPDAIQVFKKVRPLPFSTREVVQEELERLVSLDMLEPIDYSD